MLVWQSVLTIPRIEAQDLIINDHYRRGILQVVSLLYSSRARPIKSRGLAGDFWEQYGSYPTHQNMASTLYTYYIYIYTLDPN